MLAWSLGHQITVVGCESAGKQRVARSAFSRAESGQVQDAYLLNFPASPACGACFSLAAPPALHLLPTLSLFVL